MGDNQQCKQSLSTLQVASSTSKAPGYLMLLSKHRDLHVLSNNHLPIQSQLVGIPANHFKGRETKFYEAQGASSADFDSSNFHSDSGRFPNRDKGGTLSYIANIQFAYIFQSYSSGTSQLHGVQIPVPINLSLRAWHEITVTPDELWVVAFLTFGFHRDQFLCPPLTTTHLQRLISMTLTTI